MLPDLTDQFIADAFTGILHTSKIPTTGANLPPVYDGLGNKTSFSVGSDGNGASFTGTLSSGNYSIGNYATLIDYLYPIGSVYFSATDVNPQTRFTGTNWVRISEGRFIVGVGFGNDGTESKEFLEGDNQGKYQTTLTLSELPSHNHLNGVFGQQTGNLHASVYGFTRTDTPGSATGSLDIDSIQYAPSQGNTSTVGDSKPFTNAPPSFGLYVWQRTS